MFKKQNKNSQGKIFIPIQKTHYSLLVCPEMEVFEYQQIQGIFKYVQNESLRYIGYIAFKL